MTVYNYDGFGRRRNAMVTGTPPMTWWRYDAGWNMIAEYTDPNADWVIENQTSTYVPGLAEIMGADPATGAYRYYYGDNLGSNRRMRNQSKASLANYEYDPYGSLYNGAGLPLKRGYTGHTWDNDTKMYFAPYRYYMPSAARWLTRDPMGYVDGLNVYMYVANSPTSYVDPDGRGKLGDMWWVCKQAVGKGWRWIKGGKDTADNIENAAETNSATNNAIMDIRILKEESRNAGGDPDKQIELLENTKGIFKKTSKDVPKSWKWLFDFVPGADAVDVITVIDKKIHQEEDCK